jgi:hypothetical protein
MKRIELFKTFLNAENIRNVRERKEESIKKNMKIKRGKRAAFEMSMSTIVIIVLAVVFLILGLVLLRNIFGFATTSMDDINTQMKTQINDIFSTDAEKIFVLLGDQKIANVRADGNLFSFWAGARTLYGNSVDTRSSIQFTLELDKTSECYKKLNGASQISKWFVSPIMPVSGITNYSDVRDIKTTANDVGSARIQIKIPEGTLICAQEVLITFYDNTLDPKYQTIAGSSFTINVLRKSII